MKRFHLGREARVEDWLVEAFLGEIVDACKRHGFSLSHEDTHGAFIVEEYDEGNIQWLGDAMIGNSVNTAQGNVITRESQGKET
ncbi:hypothetical protein KKD19_01570 [Patescibacteria group bacterium]|nr:hypothetical protein [Patescibacteria group bacterium]MBU4511919.1 hypothetical protein [Patescibacteria group bacterium]MCG2692887.1 hypothetical protein [Candidatus Parcubacteria bacterium]